jgi:hypothetical protein
MAMSFDRGLEIQRQVLAKLMLLEYLKPEFFKHLARLQAAQQGRPADLKACEDLLRQPAPGTQVAGESRIEEAHVEEDLPKTRVRTNLSAQVKALPLAEDTIAAEVQPWLADPWMRMWLASEPALSQLDLRPYFYIAHDQVGTLADSPLRLSPAATEILNRLLDSREATQQVGLKKAENLSTADATAVFQSLAQRIRQAESLDRSPHRVLFHLMSNRPELLPQLVTLYGSLPDTKLTLSVPPLLLTTTTDTPSYDAARSVVERWEKSKHTPLARAATGALKSGMRRKQPKSTLGEE